MDNPASAVMTGASADGQIDFELMTIHTVHATLNLPPVQPVAVA